MHINDCVQQNRGEHWDLAQSRNTILIRRDGAVELFENQVLTKGLGGSVTEKVGGAMVHGCVVLLGPKTAAARERLQCLKQRQIFKQIKHATAAGDTTAPAINSGGDGRGELLMQQSILVTVSDLSTACTIVRFCAASTEEAYHLLAVMLRPLETQLPGYLPYADRLHGTPPAHCLTYPHPMCLLLQHDAAPKTCNH